jgi:hypothetical protein
MRRRNLLCASVESIQKWVLKPFCPEVRILVTKGLLQALIEHLSYAFAAPDRTFLRPLHLLLFGKPLTSQFATILSGKLFVIQETWMSSIL